MADVHIATGNLTGAAALFIDPNPMAPIASAATTTATGTTTTSTTTTINYFYCYNYNTTNDTSLL